LTSLKRFATVCGLVWLGFVAGGCARYEYTIIQPPELSRHIGERADQVVDLDPLQYRMRTVDNRLVVRIYNQTDDPIEILGDKSFTVDPEGQSHPMRAQTIAPHAFVKLIFPPLRPRIYDPGPTFGVGLGVGVSRHYYGPYGWDYYDYPPGAYYAPPFEHYYTRYYDEPRFLTVYDDSDQRYWDWEGAGGEMRLSLSFRREEQTFQHAFTFKRVKM
jgi:hypothetical protein